MNISYDLHIHSCLSPCGDNDMTPNNIVNMALLNELSAIAITDHNTTRNCAAAIKAAAGTGLIVLPGMELTTSEECHVVCLFRHVEDAEAFGLYVYEHLPDFPNRTDIFGEQLILNELDEPVGTEPRMLAGATDISVMDVVEVVSRYGGVAFPAHIDKSAFSITASLGDIPPECGFSACEIKDGARTDEIHTHYPITSGMLTLTSSDAHYLEDIGAGGRTLSLDMLSAGAVLRLIGGMSE